MLQPLEAEIVCLILCFVIVRLVARWTWFENPGKSYPLIRYRQYREYMGKKTCYTLKTLQASDCGKRFTVNEQIVAIKYHYLCATARISRIKPLLQYHSWETIRLEHTRTVKQRYPKIHKYCAYGLIPTVSCARWEGTETVIKNSRATSSFQIIFKQTAPIGTAEKHDNIILMSWPCAQCMHFAY